MSNILSPTAQINGKALYRQAEVTDTGYLYLSTRQAKEWNRKIKDFQRRKGFLSENEQPFNFGRGYARKGAQS